MFSHDSFNKLAGSSALTSSFQTAIAVFAIRLH